MHEKCFILNFKASLKHTENYRVSKMTRSAIVIQAFLREMHVRLIVIPRMKKEHHDLICDTVLQVTKNHKQEQIKRTWCAKFKALSHAHWTYNQCRTIMVLRKEIRHRTCKKKDISSFVIKSFIELKFPSQSQQRVGLSRDLRLITSQTREIPDTNN